MEEIRKDALWHDFFYTELTTGLRRGEICGLRLEDFDEESGTLNNRRTVQRQKGVGLTARDTKTYAGTKKMILPPSTAQLLRERKVMAFSPWIFPDLLHPEQPTNPTAAYGRMKALLKQAGLPSIRFHDLRHPYVKPTTKKFASFLKFFRAAVITARSCSIRYSWLIPPSQISPILKSLA